MGGTSRRVTRAELRLTRTVMRAIRTVSLARLAEYVRRNPAATVHHVCRDFLGGLDVRDYGGTHRAYAAVYNRLKRARQEAGLRPPYLRARPLEFTDPTER